MEIMEQIARDHLPDNIGLEWSGLSYQEKQAGGQTGMVMALVFLFHDLHRLSGTISLRSCSTNNGRSKHIETFDTSRSCGI